MDIKIWLALLIVGAIVGISSYLYNERKNRKISFVTGLGFLVLALIMGLVSPNYIYSTDAGGFTNLAVTTPEVPTVPGVIPGCSVDSTTITLSATDKYNASATGGTHAYRINGAPVKTVSDTGTFTASPNDKIDVLFFNADTDGAYFSEVKSFTVPCSGTKNLFTSLVANGTLTMDLFNRDGDLMNSGVANQSMVAGQTYTLNLRLSAPNNAGFPHGGVIVAEFNNTELKDVVIQTKSGASLKASNPNFFTVSSTDNVFRTYTVPALEDNAELELSVVVESSASVDPAGDDITLTFYPSNPYIDGRDGGAFKDASVEDEDDARTYDGSSSLTAYID